MLKHKTQLQHTRWTGQVGDYAYPSQVWDYDRRSGTGNGFALHGGHEGQTNFPHHVAIDMSDSYPTGIVWINSEILITEITLDILMYMQQIIELIMETTETMISGL